MATTANKHYTVQELSKYGFKANDVYVNYSKQLSESDKGKIVPGLVFFAEVYTADSGKEYVNKVISVGVAKPVEAAITTIPVVKKSLTTKPEEISKGLSKDEWAMKDQRISRQGLIQACIIALAPVVSLETLFVEAKKLAEQGLEFVNNRGE